MDIIIKNYPGIFFLSHYQLKLQGVPILFINIFTGKKTATVLPNKVIMHIDMDCFFVSVTLRKYPEHRGKPVAITHAKNGETHTDRSKSRSIEFNLMQEQGRHYVTEGSSSTSRIDNLDGFSSMSEIASASYEARKCGIKNGMFLGAAVKLCPELVTLPYDFEVLAGLMWVRVGD